MENNLTISIAALAVASLSLVLMIWIASRQSKIEGDIANLDFAEKKVMLTKYGDALRHPGSNFSLDETLEHCKLDIEASLKVKKHADQELKEETAGLIYEVIRRVNEGNFDLTDSIRNKLEALRRLATVFKN